MSKEYEQVWANFFANYTEYLHPPIRTLDFPAYMRFFEKRYSQSPDRTFVSISRPAYYKLEILKELKDNLACSGFVADSAMGRRFTMMFQFSPTVHGHCSLLFSPKHEVLFVSPIEFFSDDHSFAIDFYAKYDSFGHNEDQSGKAVGFGIAK